MTPEQQAAKIVEAADTLGTNPAWLDALINYETMGTYDPLIPNGGYKEPNKFSSAMGLIQIVDSSAKEIGFDSARDAVGKHPDFGSQIDHVVIPYLELQKRRHGPIDTQQRLYMAVFLPAYMDNDPQDEFSAYYQSKNPGIVKVQDYIDYVNKRVKTGTLRLTESIAEVKEAVKEIVSSKPFPILMVALTGVGIWYLLRAKRLL